MLFARPLWLMNYLRHPPVSLHVKILKKSVCYNLLKFSIEQHLTGRFKPTKGNTQVPTSRLTAPRTVKVSSDMNLLFQKDLFPVRSLTSFLPQFLSCQ